MKCFILLIFTSVLSMSAFSAPVDRQFNCKTTKGEDIKFKLSYGSWKQGSGYSKASVNYENGAVVPLRVSDANQYSEAILQFDGLTFYFKGSLGGPDYGFRLYRGYGDSIADGNCTDELYKPEIWPYESSTWQLDKLACGNGKSLPLPAEKTAFAIDLNGYSVTDGMSANQDMNGTYMPVLSGTVYFGGSNVTCSYNANYTFFIYDTQLATLPYWRAFYQMQPFLVVEGGGGGTATGKNCPLAPELSLGLVQSSRTEATFAQGFSDVCATPSDKDGKIFATYRREK